MEELVGDDSALCQKYTAQHTNETWREPAGALVFPYLVPAGPYDQEWDWDAVFLGTATLHMGSRPYLEGSMQNFFASTNLTDGAVTGCLTRTLPTVCSSDPKQRDALVHAKPILIQDRTTPATMAPKRKSAAQPAEAAPKQARPTRADADWRVPLFYWRGKVEGNTWEGTWVASADGLPSDADFAASPNTFKLTCSEALPRIWELTRGGGSPDHVATFKLDQGDGLADYSADIEHKIWAYDGPADNHPSIDHWTIVGASGDTEFGRFVSLGRLDKPLPHPRGVSGDDTYTRLTLARRYVADDDKRTTFSAADIGRRVISGGKDEGLINVPWLALPWKLPGNWPASALWPKKELIAVLEKHCEDEGTDWAVGVNGHAPFWKPP